MKRYVVNNRFKIKWMDYLRTYRHGIIHHNKFCLQHTMTTQSQIIKSVNAYLNHHNLPLKFDEKGICHGLCSLRTKYILKKEEEQFKCMIKKLSQIKPTDTLNDEETLFIISLFLTQNPHDFDHNLNQSQSMVPIPFTLSALKTPLHICMITNESNWIEIIRNIELQEGEALLVSGLDHTVSISKHANQYHLYDPTYGFDLCCTETLLVRDLNRRFSHTFDPSPEKLALNVRLIQHPTQSHRKIELNFNTLCEKYLKNKNKTTVTHEGQDCNSLDYALFQTMDKMSIEKLIDLGFPVHISTLIIAITSSAPGQVCLALYKQLLTTHTIDSTHDTFLLWSVVASGSNDILNTFLTRASLNQKFAQGCINYNDYQQYLINAISGKNDIILSKIFLLGKKNNANHIEVLHDTAESLIFLAIEKKYSTNLRLLLKELRQINYQITPELLNRYLLKAIQSNHFHVVRQILELIPKEQILTINLRLSLIENTQLPVLKLLQEAGVLFSGNAQSVIAQKEHQWIHYLSWISRIIEKIKDYLMNKPLLSTYPDTFFKLQKEDQTIPSSPILKQSAAF